MKKLLGLITGNPLVAGAIGVGIVVLILAITLFFRGVERGQIREEQNLKNQGATQQRDRDKGDILNAVQNANRPVTSNEQLAECLRNNRNPAACRGS